MEEHLLKRYRRISWEKYPYPRCDETEAQFKARRTYQLSEKFKDHPVIGSFLKVLELDKKRRETYQELLECFLYRLEKGLPLGKEHDVENMTEEEAKKASEEEIKKLREANSEEGAVLTVGARKIEEPKCSLVIACDGGFVSYSHCEGEGRNDLKYPEHEEFSRNLDDLTMAECFDSIEDAVSFCKKNCPPGVQVLANPCTRAEEILYTHE